MEKVYDLHQYAHCIVIHIGKTDITTYICSTSNRHFDFSDYYEVELRSAISYNKDRTDVKAFGRDCEEEAEDNIVINYFYDRLYNLFKKDKETWDEMDKFLMKAVSDYLPLAVKNTIEKNELEIESFDLFHYAFIVPSEWEEEIRDDIIRPIFIRSGLISNEDHQDRLLFFSDIESIFYELKDENKKYYSFKRGQNTIMCRISPDKEKIVVKFDLIQTMNTLYSFPNAKFFPKVIKSRSVSVTANDIEGCTKDFLRTNLFPVATDDGGVRKSLKSKLIPVDQDQIIEDIIEVINSWRFSSLDKETKENTETESWITCKKSWMLSEIQKEFIQSLCPSIVCTEIGTALFSDMKNIISSNSTNTCEFLLLVDAYSNQDNRHRNMFKWLTNILEYNRRSLNYIKINLEENYIQANFLLAGAGIGVFEAIQHSDIYCKPRIMLSKDLTISPSVFINSKPDAIVNLDISLGSTLFACSLLNEDGLTQQIFNHDYFIADNLPPLGHYFYTFSNTTTLHVKEQFIPFAKRYLLGDLADFTVGEGASIKKGLLLEMKAILTQKLSAGEELISTDKSKYIKAFILMYMIYIKEEILHKLPDHLRSNQLDIKIGYAISIEAMLLNNTIGTKDNLRDLIFASGLVPKGNDSKKLRITTQGEGILPAIQKSLKLEFTLRSYFLLCQLHENYVQLSLHQIVTAFSSEEKEQESIIVQDEIIVIPNIYDSLCKSMWHNLVQDSSLIELCEMHDTSNNNKILDLFSSKIKTDFFANLRVHISDNVLKNNPGAQNTVNTNAVKLNNSCNCKVRLTTADIIDISFTPVLQNISCTISASLLNKKLFGSYINIDYMFSFIHFSSNLQLQYAFARILEEETDDFNLELGIDTSCLLVPELFRQLLQSVISQQPFCYNDFKTGALQQVCSENYIFGMTQNNYRRVCPLYKAKITDTKGINCFNTVFPFLNKGEIMNNVRSNKTFYLCNKKYHLRTFSIEIHRFKTMNYLEDNEALFLDDKISQSIDSKSIAFKEFFNRKDVDVPVMILVRYVSYSSSVQFFVKLVGTDTRNKKVAGVMEASEPLTLTRL